MKACPTCIWILKVKVIYWPCSKVTSIKKKNKKKKKFFSLQTTRPIKAKFHVEPPWNGRTKVSKFHVEPPWDGRTKVCSNAPGHMTSMAAMLIYGKKLKKNLLLWNSKADDLESWYAALGFRALSNLFKRCPWVDLDLFYGKVKFGPLCYCIGKVFFFFFFQKLL